METASKQISELFMDLLEQQFRIEEQPYTITLRHAFQFADRLNIHVNHLNRSLRETLDKTTTQIISECILREAKHLLRTRNWRIFEIAYTDHPPIVRTVKSVSMFCKQEFSTFQHSENSLKFSS